jgi:LmbE family N-acetylglucosaminyl deacetylase
MAGILIVGAHALDAEVMAGGLAAQAARLGIPVILLHLTRGERGHPTKSPDEFGRQLEEEMEEAARRLGVQQHWPELRAPLDKPAQATPLIRDVIVKNGVDTVITHWQGSWHQSHVRAHLAVKEALRSLDTDISLFYGENCEDLTGFQAEWFVPIDEVYAQWVEALEAYELFRFSLPGHTGGNSIPYWAYYTAAARIRALQSGLEKAQSFMREEGHLPAPLEARNAPIVASAES